MLLLPGLNGGRAGPVQSKQTHAAARVVSGDTFPSGTVNLSLHLDHQPFTFPPRTPPAAIVPVSVRDSVEMIPLVHEDVWPKWRLELCSVIEPLILFVNKLLFLVAVGIHALGPYPHCDGIMMAAGPLWKDPHEDSSGRLSTGHEPGSRQTRSAPAPGPQVVRPPDHGDSKPGV